MILNMHITQYNHLSSHSLVHFIILCLLVSTFQQENVVVDTVLIIDTPENVTQKAITHASGEIRTYVTL